MPKRKKLFSVETNDKKINMNVDPSFSAHSAADQKPGDKRSAEVMIPAFLMVASPEEAVQSKK